MDFMDVTARTRWRARSAASVHGVVMAVMMVMIVTVATLAAEPRSKDTLPPGEVLLVQVLLDRAGFSVGEIDGAAGTKTRKALNVLRSAWMPAPPPESDPAMVRALAISMAS